MTTQLPLTVHNIRAGPEKDINATLKDNYQIATIQLCMTASWYKAGILVGIARIAGKIAASGGNTSLSSRWILEIGWTA